MSYGGNSHQDAQRALREQQDEYGRVSYETVMADAICGTTGLPLQAVLDLFDGLQRAGVTTEQLQRLSTSQQLQQHSAELLANYHQQHSASPDQGEFFPEVSSTEIDYVTRRLMAGVRLRQSDTPLEDLIQEATSGQLPHKQVMRVLQGFCDFDYLNDEQYQKMVRLFRGIELMRFIQSPED